MRCRRVERQFIRRERITGTAGDDRAVASLAAVSAGICRRALCGSCPSLTMTWTWKSPGNSTRCIRMRSGPSCRSATGTQSSPDAFWTMPTCQNGLRSIASITGPYSTLTTFWLRLGASGTTFDSRGCRSSPRTPPTRFRTSGFPGFAARVAAWIDYPDRVRLVRVILGNQNTPLGYMAESQLALSILDRFPDVPWDPKWREASEASLEKYRRESAAET